MPTYWAITLSKAGYGTVPDLLQYPADIFMSLLNYEQFYDDYNAEIRALNRRE
ncbi:MAG: hypothetical protein IIW86_02840 [Clostridia bacterium]|nr:hypothetical protein [Clostridia bacterium]MBQ5900778.1 hypothetical protein [Clostridia bacterium]